MYTLFSDTLILKLVTFYMSAKKKKRFKKKMVINAYIVSQKLFRNSECYGLE